ncbi:hypothetical protein EVY06_18040 [Citrobacter koseri]|uniref:Protein YoaJ n=1 Tax=Citrobacter koseri TaxID=545 RepID=A0AAQ0VC00_CITKO|nr:hypothetical protein AM351_11115 [Citrobacter koseri]AVK74107.1 hypothetical protein CEP66_24760 [Citrobacter koseri]MBE0024382.1 hypothetical protein [Citrobacter koseri]MBE0081782.1 hypothetical protein [Citrobacter koseri]MBI0678000.1 hypothetical protein [Citrobacter koseri]
MKKTTLIMIGIAIIAVAGTKLGWW